MLQPMAVCRLVCGLTEPFGGGAEHVEALAQVCDDRIQPEGPFARGGEFDG